LQKRKEGKLPGEGLVRLRFGEGAGGGRLVVSGWAFGPGRWGWLLTGPLGLVGWGVSPLCFYLKVSLLLFAVSFKTILNRLKIIREKYIFI
jgi:hypothetical protein